MKTKPAKRTSRPTAQPVPDNSNAPVIDLVRSYLRLKKILVPVDFSEFSTKAIKYAARFAEQFVATLVLVHVVEPVRYPESVLIPPEMEEANRERLKLAREALAEFVRKQVPADIPTETATRLGHPFSEIGVAAKDFDVDLIVIATHGHTGLKHLFLGSTAERVVRLAPCPVLTVREREHEFV
ncbi:MAG: universal stress protein [Limisphaerales bacterium]